MAADLRREADARGLNGSVRLRGETDGIDAALDGADILLLTSRGEGTPLVLMEALARLTPVVASAVGGVPEIVTDGETGLLVPPADAGALAAAVARMAADPARRGRWPPAGGATSRRASRWSRASRGCATRSTPRSRRPADATRARRRCPAPTRRRKHGRRPPVARSWMPRPRP